MAAISNNHSLPNSTNHCAFCKRNKEPETIYASHMLKDGAGLVTCPQLFKYRCELCGATGQLAHTRSYCPLANTFRRQCQKTKQEDLSHESNSSSESSPREIIKVEPGMFRNMSKVTNSKYNSAGRLRFQYRDQQSNQTRQASGSYPRVDNNHGNKWRPQNQNQNQQRQQQQSSQPHLYIPQTHQYYQQPSSGAQLRGQIYNENFAGNSL